MIKCFDIEANGLLDSVTQIHCAVVENITTGEVEYYRPSEIESLTDSLAEATTLVGHNIIGYDLPVLKKLLGFEYQGKILDTLVMSRLGNTNRPMHPHCPTSVWDEHNQKNKQVGPHTLMNLGYYAGAKKGDFGAEAGWETYSEAMLDYCEQDVAVNVMIYHYLLKELRGFSDYAIQLEMDIAGYIAQQQVNGWYFDIRRAYNLDADLQEKIRELEDEVHKTFKPLAKAGKLIQPRVKKDGTVSSVGLKFLQGWESLIPVPDSNEGEFGIEYLSGSFTRIDWPEFNLGSRQQIVEQLLHRGWKPNKFTEKGTPMVDEQVLEGLKNKFSEASLLADYFMVSKRQSMVASWIEKYDEDTGRIHGYVNSLGAVTGRMTHSSPNLAQVPATKVDSEGHPIWGFEGGYGADCRALFTVPSGYKQVGCDASGLELRCLAHYMNDSDYTELILHGDIHTANQKAAGLAARNQAKTFIYAFLYGAGDAKIGSIVGGSSKAGKELKKKFLDNTPALKALREGVLKAAERGWLKGIDGRKVRVRSAHAALNSLLQSCGAIIMKVWLRQVIQRAEGLDFKAVGNIHDEGQFEVALKDVQAFCKICEESMIAAGEELKTRIKIEGEAMVGDNWSDTH